MTLKTTLLATVAVCGLMATPALARSAPPNIHLFAMSGVPLTAHVKTGVNPSFHHNTTLSYTSVQTFSGSISISADAGVKIDLLGDTWYDPSTCTFPAKGTEKWDGLPKHTKYAKVGQTVVKDPPPCGKKKAISYPTITYTLGAHGKVGKTDTVKGTLTALDFNGYNLYLVATIDLTFTS